MQHTQESKGVTYWLGQDFPSDDTVRGWKDKVAAVYHVRWIITRIERTLAAVRSRRDTNSWLYDLNQLLVLSAALKRKKALLHELTAKH
jgi:hypothetical protein